QAAVGKTAAQAAARGSRPAPGRTGRRRAARSLRASWLGSFGQWGRRRAEPTIEGEQLLPQTLRTARDTVGRLHLRQRLAELPVSGVVASQREAGFRVGGMLFAAVYQAGLLRIAGEEALRDLLLLGADALLAQTGIVVGELQPGRSVVGSDCEQARIGDGSLLIPFLRLVETAQVGIGGRIFGIALHRPQ